MALDIKRGSSRPCKIVIKLGTSSIVHEITHQPLISTLSSVVETVLKLKSQGHKVVIVSSGAVGVGLLRMDIATKPKELEKKQALAAIGQGRLIALWDSLFGHMGQPIAQVLLTRGDISDKTRYLNAVNTLTELLSMDVIPIINENDTVSANEIKFGDNDTLSAITSSMINADYLFLLTDVDGLYTANPRKDPTARAIDNVISMEGIRLQVDTASEGSAVGTGGMETKLIAAEIATEAGVATVICSSKHPDRVFEIIEYNNNLASTHGPDGSAPDWYAWTGNASAESSRSNSRAPSPGPHAGPLFSLHPMHLTPKIIRPPHTMFRPSLTPLRDLRSWTLHTLRPAGGVVINDAAHAALSNPESNGCLPPEGVIGVIGSFTAGQAVRIYVWRRKVNLEESDLITSKVDNMLSSHNEPPTMADVGREAQLPKLSETWTDEGKHGASEQSGKGWEEFEVGRGLAMHKSSQIKKGVKGLNIEHTIGQSVPEFVVENITIRICA